MPPRPTKKRKRPPKKKVLHKVNVAGSHGKRYDVSILEGGKVRCQCLGFRYRQECRHILDPEIRELAAHYAPPRRPRAEVMALANLLALAIRPYCQYIEIVGSLRRGRQDVKDIDIIFIPGAWSSAQICALFRTFGAPVHHGETMGAIVLPTGVPAQLWPVEDPAVLGAALLHVTGPRDYNISIRIRANRRGWQLSQHGLVDRATGRLIAGRSEEEVLQALDLPWLPPPMREKHRKNKDFATTKPNPGLR